MASVRIIWHDRDLRIQDNPAVAAASDAILLPLFIYCPEEEKKWKRGAASKWWLHHSLDSLASDYQKHKVKLVIRSGTAEKVLKKLLSEVAVEGVYWNIRYEPALMARDDKIQKMLEKEGIEVKRYQGNYLIHPTDVLNGSHEAYSVFTPFSKKVLEVQDLRKPLKTPTMHGNHRVKSETLQSLDLLPKRDWADSFTERWTPGRAGAMQKLRVFKKKVGDYKTDRDLPSEYSTSRLSPHLHFGEISPYEIWDALEGSSKKAEPYLRQLLWREFGNYFLFHNPKAPDRSWKENFERFPWSKSKKHLHAWQKGMTGYPIVDAGMRELWHTGWMHNRVRMIVGSFLVKDLFIHWIEGAKWFWDTLVDADLANNTLGWQWVAGCGPDAAPYFRIFNPILQGKKFDPDGEYVRQWVPELADVEDKYIHAPWEAPEPPEDYPAPIVDHFEMRKKALKAYEKIK